MDTPENSRQLVEEVVRRCFNDFYNYLPPTMTLPGSDSPFSLMLVAEEVILKEYKNGCFDRLNSFSEADTELLDNPFLIASRKAGYKDTLDHLSVPKQDI